MSEALRKLANKRKEAQLKRDIEAYKDCKLFRVSFDTTTMFFYAFDVADVISQMLEDSDATSMEFIEKGNKLYVVWSEDYQEEVHIEEEPIVRGCLFHVSH
jgi:hypothetical protein